MVAMNEKTRTYTSMKERAREQRKNWTILLSLFPSFSRARSLFFFSPPLSLRLSGRPHCMHNLKTTMFMSNRPSASADVRPSIYMFSCSWCLGNQTSVDMEQTIAKTKDSSPAGWISRIPDPRNKARKGTMPLSDIPDDQVDRDNSMRWRTVLMMDRKHSFQLSLGEGKSSDGRRVCVSDEKNECINRFISKVINDARPAVRHGRYSNAVLITSSNLIRACLA